MVCLENLKNIECHIEKPPHSFRAGLLNARSVANKSGLLRETVMDYKIQMLAVTETWLKEGDDSIILDLCPPNYRFHGAPRPVNKGSRGGGIGIVISSDIRAEPVFFNNYRTFEAMALKIKARRSSTVALIYRPPPSHRNGYTTSEFLTECETFLSHICTEYPGELTIMGDFNLHLDVKDDYHTRLFQDILAAVGLQQHVTQGTHKSGHMLDLVITRKMASNLANLKVQETVMSDHALITFDIATTLTKPPLRQVTARSIKRVDRGTFAQDVRQLFEESLGSNAVLDYNTTITKAMDLHAPLHTVKVKGESQKPWYSEEIHVARQKRRQLERKFLKTRLEVHRQMFEEHSRLVVKLIDSKKSEFFKNKFQAASMKETFNLVKDLLMADSEKILPSSSNPQDLANAFASFFEEKIKKIRETLDKAAPLCLTVEDNHQTAAELSQYNQVSQEDISNIIKKCPSKSCALDPIPTSLLKDSKVSNAVVPSITAIINSSITSGTVPKDLKVSHVIPLIKKPGLDREIFKNYRPVSNLAFLHKILEKVVASQLTAHLAAHGLNDPLQSAYRRGHSTESAMLKIKADLDLILDKGDAALVVLLDLSAAFDTIDHKVLLSRLQTYTGVTRTALLWIRSYLTDRKQIAVVNGAKSKQFPLSVGVPQGSVLGPLLFSIYILPLRAIIEKHDILRHGYADDLQLYCRLPFRRPVECEETVEKVNRCVSEIRNWMLVNKLLINDSKTESLLVMNKAAVKQVDKLEISVTVGTEKIKPSKSVRNLGATLDAHLSMESHIANMTRSAYYHLRRIQKIRCHLDTETCRKIVHSCVTSRLDYHNGLLTGVSDKALHRLQLVQNNAARVITGTKLHEHIRPVLYTLHWLPIKERIAYKVLMFVHMALHNSSAPEYLRDLVTIYHPTRSLRSASDPWTLTIMRTHNLVGTKSFPVHGAKVWNSLPLGLRENPSRTMFKKDLKTYLFRGAYSEM